MQCPNKGIKKKAEEERDIKSGSLILSKKKSSLEGRGKGDV